MITEPLLAIARSAARAAVLVDFDGSLAPVVDDPALAVPLPAARGALGALVGRVARVGVVSGRPIAFLRAALGLDGIAYVGQYGLERLEGDEVVLDPRALPYLATVAETAGRAERELTPLRVERKGDVAVALHWREHPERAGQVRAWAEAEAARTGLASHPGRLVLELRPPVPVDKGTAVAGLCRGLAVAAFAGDDLGDVAAFRTLERLVGQGRLEGAARIAVRSPEEPEALVAAADVVVEGPAGLAKLLAELAATISREPA